MIHVVIADDQPLVRTGLRMILSTEADIEVVGEAANGAEAVAVCATQKPDVVLMDVRMPEVDGLEVIRQIRADDQISGMLVIALSAGVQEANVAEGLEAGADEYMEKPFSPRKLIELVEAKRSEPAADRAGDSAGSAPQS